MNIKLLRCCSKQIALKGNSSLKELNCFGFFIQEANRKSPKLSPSVKMAENLRDVDTHFNPVAFRMAKSP